MLCLVLISCEDPQNSNFWSYGQFSIEAPFWPPTPFKRKKKLNSLPLALLIIYMQLFAKIFHFLWFDPISKGIGKLQKMISQILKFLTLE
jgi:hypothetical protein